MADDEATPRQKLEETRRRLAAVPDPLGLLAGLFAHSPVAFQIYSVDGRSVLVNDAFVALFGSVPPPEYNVLRDEIAERNGVLDLIHRAFAGETISTPPIWYDARELTQVKVEEGRRAGIKAVFFPIRDAAGAVVYVAIAFADVTAELEKREAVERAGSEARRGEQRMAFLATVSARLAEVSGLDASLEALARETVPAFADLCAIVLAQPDGTLKRVAEIAADAETKQAMRALREIPTPTLVAESFATGTTTYFADYARTITDRLGADHPYVQAITPLAPRGAIVTPIMARGRHVGVLTLGMTARSGRAFADEDVSLARELGQRSGMAIENARLFAEAEDARRRAEDLGRAKDEFLAMLGHELRNPLAPIVTALQILRLRSAANPVPREHEIIERQVRHLVRLVDDLLDVSRVTRGGVQLRRARVELLPVVTRAIEQASPLLEEKHHALEVSVPAAGLAIDGDDQRLVQIVANLLSNAARYTPGKGRIRVSAEAVGDFLELRVRDDGIGISRELLSLIFEPFVQGRQPIARSQGGLGLGLTIVRSLVEAHGGRVSAESGGPGAGSEFLVRLPRATGPEKPPTAAPAVANAAARPGQRVLIVDDNEDAAELLADALGNAGCEVRVATDGPRALEVAREFAPAAALLDIGLPAMDGYEVARRMRAGHASILLVAVTGYGQAADRERALAAGFDEHLVKPVAVEELLRLLAAAPEPSA